MNHEIIAMTAGYLGVRPRTLRDVKRTTRVHVAIESWIEDRFLFDDIDTSNRLARWTIRRASGKVN